jgi:hypothetical protein
MSNRGTALRLIPASTIVIITLIVDMGKMENSFGPIGYCRRAEQLPVHRPILESDCNSPAA